MKNLCVNCRHYKQESEFFSGRCAVTGNELNSYQQRSPLSYGCKRHFEASAAKKQQEGGDKVG